MRLTPNIWMTVTWQGHHTAQFLTSVVYVNSSPHSQKCSFAYGQGLTIPKSRSPQELYFSSVSARTSEPLKSIFSCLGKTQSRGWMTTCAVGGSVNRLAGEFYWMTFTCFPILRLTNPRDENYHLSWSLGGSVDCVPDLGCDIGVVRSSTVLGSAVSSESAWYSLPLHLSLLLLCLLSKITE